MPRRAAITRIPGYLNATDLKNRGWSAAMMQALLGVHDAELPNPRYRSAAAMRLYDEARVETAEASAEFERRRAAARLRGEAASRSAASRIAMLADRARGMAISVARLDEEALRTLAREEWTRRDARGRAERRSAGESPAAFQRRIEVNYARHRLTDYDRALDDTAARVGATAAREIIRRRVYNAIAAAYPRLDGECRRQMRKRSVAIEATLPEASREPERQDSAVAPVPARSKAMSLAAKLLDG